MFGNEQRLKRVLLSMTDDDQILRMLKDILEALGRFFKMRLIWRIFREGCRGIYSTNVNYEKELVKIKA